MKKIDIIIIKELFLLRYNKQYPRQVMKDFCDYIDCKLYGPGYLDDILPVRSYKSFIEDLEQSMLACNPKDFVIRKHFKEYLEKFRILIYEERF